MPFRVMMAQYKLLSISSATHNYEGPVQGLRNITCASHSYDGLVQGMRNINFSSHSDDGPIKSMINITCASHSYDGPVQSLRKGIKHCVWLILLQSIAQTSKYQHSHANCHAQQQQFSNKQWFIFVSFSDAVKNFQRGEC